MGGINRKTVSWRGIVSNFKPNEFALTKQGVHDMLGHPAPAKAGEQKVETATKIDKAPDSRAANAI